MITVETEGQVLTMRDLAWESLSVTRSVENLTSAWEAVGVVPKGCFDFAAETKSGPWIQPGAAVTLRYGSLLLLSGYMDAPEVERDANAHTLTLRGRSRTCDLVDCDVIEGTVYEGATPVAIATALVSDYGLNVYAPAGLPVVPRFATQTGEKVFEALDRLATQAGVLMRDTPAGDLVLWRLDSDAQPDDFPLDRVKATRITCDASRLYTDYYGIGQTRGTNGVSALVSDLQSLPTGRYRPLVCRLEGEAVNDLAYRRAAWEMQTRLARMLQIQVTVAGWAWTDSTGTQRLHEPGALRIYTDLEHGINSATMLVSDVVFRYTPEGGHETELTLVSPEAMTPEVRGAAAQVKKQVAAKAKVGFMSYYRTPAKTPVQ